jgi:hypothetical protein
MSELGKQFRQYMVQRGFAAATKESYEGAMIALVRAHGGISPDQLTCDQVQAHLARLIGERRLSWNTVNVHACASHLSAQTGRAGGAMHPCGNTARFGSPHGPFGAIWDRLLIPFASTPRRSCPSFRRAGTKRGIQTP